MIVAKNTFQSILNYLLPIWWVLLLNYCKQKERIPWFFIKLRNLPNRHLYPYHPSLQIQCPVSWLHRVPFLVPSSKQTLHTILSKMESNYSIYISIKWIFLSYLYHTHLHKIHLYIDKIHSLCHSNHLWFHSYYIQTYNLMCKVWKNTLDKKNNDSSQHTAKY